MPALWHAASNRPRAELRLTSLGGMAMVFIGLLAATPVNFVGRVYIGESLLGLAAPATIPLVLSLPGNYGRLAKMFLIAMVISWLGYIGSDLYRGTPTNDYLRGWFRWVALLSSYSTLVWLGAKNVRLVVFFTLGWCLGSALYPIAAGGGMGVYAWWKFYAGFPACVIAAYFLGKMGPWIAGPAMLVMGGLSIVLDSRAIMMTCFVVSGLTLLAGRRAAISVRRGTREDQNLSKSKTVVALITLVICGAASMFVVQKIGERFGYAERFERSNVKRWTNIEIAYSILKESPIIGYGSWARDPEVARIRDKVLESQLKSHIYRSESQDELVIVHSQLLQSWVEGGLIGLVFFVVYGWNLAEKGLKLAAVCRYEPLTPLIIFILVTAAWHFFASPFSGPVRVVIIVACVLMCYLAEESLPQGALDRQPLRMPPWRRSLARPASI